MKTIFKTLIVTLFFSCTQAQTLEKETVKEFLETRKGVRYDINLEYKEFTIKTITVADSIQILEERFKKEQTTKLNTVNSQIASLEKRINKENTSTNSFDNVVEASLQKRYKHDLEKANTKKEEIEKWKPDYLNTYSGNSDLEQPLVKRADAVFMAQKPNENISAEYKQSFILSLDGTKCYKTMAYPTVQ